MFASLGVYFLSYLLSHVSSLTISLPRALSSSISLFSFLLLCTSWERTITLNDIQCNSLGNREIDGSLYPSSWSDVIFFCLRNLSRYFHSYSQSIDRASSSPTWHYTHAHTLSLPPPPVFFTASSWIRFLPRKGEEQNRNFLKTRTVNVFLQGRSDSGNGRMTTTATNTENKTKKFVAI